MRRLFLIPFGVLLALGLTEVLLRIGAAVVQPVDRAVPALAPFTGETILCVGDSNTYGFYLDEKDSYPSQLQGLLGDTARVINIGFPGLNSSRLLAELGKMLDAVQPAVVLIQVGATDSWTAPAAGAGEPWASRLARWSRTYRLLYMLWRSAAGAPTIDVPRMTKDRKDMHADEEVTATVGDQVFALGWEFQGQPQWEAVFRDNLRRIVEMIRERGGRPVVLTYPSDNGYYRQASHAIVAAAGPLGVPMIDLHARFAALCAARDCGPLFFGDGHPTAEGYAVVARAVADELR